MIAFLLPTETVFKVIISLNKSTEYILTKNYDIIYGYYGNIVYHTNWLNFTVGVEKRLYKSQMIISLSCKWAEHILKR